MAAFCLLASVLLAASSHSHSILSSYLDGRRRRIARFSARLITRYYSLARRRRNLGLTFIPNDDTQWLVYWVCFAAMYLVMLASDDILYWIPGYHSAMLTFVCYLMLPVFNGADSVFRGILVPVFGLKAQLLRRDARVLAEESTKGLTEEQKAAVVASFNEGVSKKTN